MDVCMYVRVCERMYVYDRLSVWQTLRRNAEFMNIILYYMMLFDII